MKNVNVSVVLYENTYHEIKTLVDELKVSESLNKIYIIDNSKHADQRLAELPVEYIFNNTNLGFGKAHNIVLRQSIADNIKYHIIVNPDITVNKEAIDRIVDFLETNDSIGALMPKVVYPSGKIQRLCKLLPTPMDLISRRFLPKFFSRKRMKRYELHASGYNKIFEIPYLCGCFMVLRVEALKEIGLFDERYFLYPEDIDLSRRMHERFRTVFYPDATVIHGHRRASYNNPKLLLVHSINIIRYFNKWGWIWDKKRKKINRQILEQVDKLNKS
jgi:GT2 family glycosyltransferase